MSESSNSEAMRKILKRLSKTGTDWAFPKEGIPGVSDHLLIDWQKAILEHLAEDDATPTGLDKPWQVREEPDWKASSDLIEDELTKRKVPFQKVQW